MIITGITITMATTTTSAVWRLPLEGGGWNATGLARPTQQRVESSSGELSPMAFLVGVTGPQTNGRPHPARHDHLAPQLRAPRCLVT
jgi:hypothetical protein